MRFNHLTPADYREVPWANGRGRTVELVRLTDDAGGLLVRLSVADVVEDGPFSTLTGIDRVLTLIEGDGFDLEFGGTAPGVTARSFEPIAFSGDWTTTAARVRGPSRDFNVMTPAGSYEVTVRRLPEEPSLWPSHDRSDGRVGISGFYVVSGSAIIGALGLYLQGQELLLIEGNDPIDIDPAGNVLALRLKPLK
jgi:environmental stress-induced protein Ves